MHKKTDQSPDENNEHVIEFTMEELKLIYSMMDTFETPFEDMSDVVHNYKEAVKCESSYKYQEEIGGISWDIFNKLSPIVRNIKVIVK